MPILHLLLGLSLAFLCLPAFAQKLYKHLDEKGNVVYSDRPEKAAQKAEKTRKPNVESREATRQTYNELNQRQREEAAERSAQRQRAGALSAREREEKKRQRQRELEQYPERGPREIRVVP